MVDNLLSKVNISAMKTILTTDKYEAWFNGLKDSMAKKRITARIQRMEDDNFCDCAPVVEGVSRIHCGSGYRVYFIQNRIEIVILLAGGDQSTQEKDIEAAINLSKEL
jgi:putative addiction module killer protein